MRRPGRGNEAGDQEDGPSRPAERERKERGPARPKREARAGSRASARTGRSRETAPEETSRRAGFAKAAAGLGTALKQGAAETRKRSDGVPTQIAKSLLAIAGRLFAIFFDALAVILTLAAFVYARVKKPASALLRTIGRAVGAASRVVTPVRALTAVVAGAAVLLALSQFADYRGVSIGTDSYAEVETIAPAPERERSETGSAHGYAMVPVAIACLAVLAFAVAGRRWQLLRIVALAGLAAIVVSLVVDRPQGLDPGELEVAYEGVEARLLGGFYAQLFAGLVMAVSALLLSRELRLAGAPARAPRRRQRESRRSPKAEGARA